MKSAIYLVIFLACQSDSGLQAQHEIEILPGGVITSRLDHSSIEVPQEGQFIFDDQTKTYWLYDGQEWQEQVSGSEFSYSDDTNGNTIAGMNAGIVNFPDIGHNSTALGVGSSYNSVNGNDNTFLGIFTGMQIKRGTKNTLVGAVAGLNLDDGYENIALGNGAGFNLHGSVFNLIMGTGAGLDLSVGGYNTVIGIEALQKNKDYAGNIAIGKHALRFNGSDPTILSSSIPNLNIAIGHQAAAANLTGSKLTIIGSHGLENGEEARDVSSFGYAAGQHTAIGRMTAFGSHAGSVSCSPVDNVFIGANAGKQSTAAYHNTFVGALTGYHNETGNANTFIGHSSGYSSVGDDNVFIGDSSGANNGGDGNVFIGHSVGFHSASSNQLMIDNSDSDKALIVGDFSQNHEAVTINATFSVTDILQLEPQKTSPQEPIKGDIYMHLDNDQVKLRYYDGQQWNSL